MRTLVLMIIVFFSINNNSLLAQEKLIDLRFEGKSDGLLSVLLHNIQYPVESQENNSMGYSISGITITPKGEIDNISIINSINNSIDEEVKRVLKMTKNKWLKSDSITTNQTFYVQIVFVINTPSNPSEDYNQVKDGYNFLESAFVTAVAVKGNPKSNISISKEISKFCKSENYEEAKKNIDELIRRNPFNKDLYQLRISINKKINRNDLILKDVEKIQNFIPGVSLDELIN